MLSKLKNKANVNVTKKRTAQLKQSLHETRRRECELAIEVALNQVKSELLKNEMDILKKEREEAAELAKNRSINRNNDVNTNAGPSNNDQGTQLPIENSDDTSETESDDEPVNMESDNDLENVNDHN
ncbi:unnamed protein product [Brachionus calyciflorus]|uniref:Uncharacterized protein n=1 Tax=Brachionus calyciflorus TaxID=104777 RepID=A0A814M6S2_9BILA|nr:unnamed protein product [Brachionus calyciflorus]